MAALKAAVSAAAWWFASSEELDSAAGMLDTMALPDVDFFMGAAQAPLKEFGQQAAMLQEQVAQSEREKKEAVVKMKASFEQNLTTQARLSHRIVEDSAGVTAAIRQQDQAIRKLRREAEMVQKSNDVMRSALDSLRPRMRLAATFLGDSINLTDDSNATELDVLRPTTPAPTLEHFLETMGRGRKVSLLELQQQRVGEAVTLRTAKKSAPEANPEELVETLAQRVEDLAKAGDQGEAQLQARFLADYELGEKRRAEVLSRKQALEEDYSQKVASKAQIIHVKEHLLRIRSELQERVRGVRLFAERGSDVATEALGRAASAAKPSTF